MRFITDVNSQSYRRKNKRTWNIAGYSRSLNKGSRALKKFWKEPFLLTIISFELRVSQSEKKLRIEIKAFLIESRIIKIQLMLLISWIIYLVFHDCYVLWFAEKICANFSTCLSVLLPFNAKSIDLTTTSMAEYGAPGAKLYTFSLTLGINLQHHSISVASSTYACWCSPIWKRC